MLAHGAPRSFSKAIFILGPTLEQPKKMMLSKAVPDGLEPQECERGSGCNKPTILYIPKKDELQEVVDATTQMIKLTLLGKEEL